MGNACYYSVEELLSSLLSKNLKVRIYKTVILPVVLYGCETWTLTLGEEHRLRLSENKVLRKIFGAKRDEVTGEWRKLHNTELHALYSSPDIIRNIKSRRLRWAGHVARMGESRNAYRVLVGRLEGKRPLGRPRRRWEDNIKKDLREVGYDDRDVSAMGAETCAVCRQPAQQRCGGCHVTYYCCRDHQRLDWKGHRERCKPFKEMRNGKATGVDGISTELVKCLDEDKKEILSLCNEINEQDDWPEDFTETVLLPIPKNNNVKKCNEFRTISLISHSAKILLRILNRRLYSKMEEQLEEKQFGFRKGKVTRDAVGLLQTIGERYLKIFTILFFLVAENKILGRHLIATRDLKVGEIILQELPLVAGPSQVTPPVCLGCYRLLTEQNAKTCTECGWPVCSEVCAHATAHRAECSFTKLHKGSKVTVRNFQQPHPIYQCVTALRCLYLRDSNPVAWERLQSLESHCAERKKTPRYEEDRVTVAQFVRRFFCLQEFSEDDILRVCGILQVNGHEVPVTEPAHVAVYDQASLLEHSCRPNCAKSFTSEGGLIVRTMEPVLKGQHLSICYTDALWGTANRRHHLAETKFFWCRCTRCADPTEFGTHFSAIRCLEKPCEGFMLPENSLSEERELEKASWRCTRCSAPVPARQVLGVLERVGVALTSMQKGDPRACERFLSQFAPELHPNHYYLTDVRLALAQLYGQDSDVGLPGVSDHDLTEKISLCRQLLSLVNALVPGMCHN
ncbi:hypothetical protein ANN_14455 [Periplaneta americana]|uniref:Protein msta n=1 Tax=Periplaneta americana TaxID=6978 RepID=A0ABQ8SYI0_PERAM|nr:hypothetical protein ANN_14455 [Periplaneta americana]